jgi:hypothetical protein
MTDQREQPKGLSKHEIALTVAVVGLTAIVFFPTLRWLERYPEDGLFSVRVHVYVTDSESKSLEAGKAFIRQLFPEVLSWRRF